MTKHDADRKVKILDFIAATLRARGFPPSVREIMKAVGLASTSAVHHHLQDTQQSLRHLEVALIAGVVKWDQDLVGQPPDAWRHPTPRRSWVNDNSPGRS